MKKKMLVFLLFTSIILSGGCSTIGDTATQISKFPKRTFKERNFEPLFHPFREVYRGDQNRNKEQFAVSNEVDFSSHEDEYIGINGRFYLKEEPALAESEFREGVLIEPTKTVSIDLPRQEELTIPEIGATGFRDGLGGVTFIYPCRNPAPDVKKLLEDNLTGVKVSEFPNDNSLLLKFDESKLDNEDFMRQLGIAINMLDRQNVMVWIKFRLFNLWVDNTYNREQIINVLKDGIQAFHFNLPSSYNADEQLNTGISVNPFYNIQGWHDFTFEGSIGFLDSFGEIDNLMVISMPTANTKTLTYSDILDVPYPTYILAGQNVVEVLEYKEVGAKLKITPFASQNGLITVKVEQAETGELSALLDKTQRPTFKKSDFTAEIILQSGVPQIVVASQTNRFHSVNRGAPGLNKLPIFKLLTTSMAYEKSRSEFIGIMECIIVQPGDSVGMLAEPIKKYKQR